MVKAIILTSLFSFIVFISCVSPATAPLTKEVMPSQTLISGQILPSWQVEWEKTLIEARKEGKVILYSSTPEFRNAVAERFKDKYGIEMEGISGRTAELAEKILRERKAGIYNADLFMGGSTTMTITFKPAGILEPIEPLLILPEVKDPSVWWMGKLNFVDKDHLILNFIATPTSDIAIINTQLAKKEELSSVKDLMDPKWHKRIVIYDPTRPGTAQQSATIVAQELGWDFWREFVKQMPVITSDRRLQVEWVARGKYPIGLFHTSTLMIPFIELGLPIEEIGFPEVQVLYGTAGHISLFKNAPNPNARKVFVNWLLTKEGQTSFSKLYLAHSTRLDVSTDHLPAKNIRQQGVKYLSIISEEFTLTIRVEAAKYLTEIFGPLIK